MINHRIWFKILFNPILRKFGWSIVSKYCNNKNKIIGYELRKYPKYCEVYE